MGKSPLPGMHMKNKKLFRALVSMIIFGTVVAVSVVWYFSSVGPVEIHAATPDKGGWLTSNIQASAGVPLRLRLISDDVVHSFAIGQSDFAPVDVLPGKATDLTLTFDQPGVYTFYCTRWCGADHWRMRGTITVVGDEPEAAKKPEPPYYLQLGIELDAPHELHNLEFEGQPSVESGGALDLSLNAEFLNLDYYRSHSPQQTWDNLRGDSITKTLTDAQIWDLVAWVWAQNTTPEALATGGMLYERDCAACHGVNGAGDGIFGVKDNSGSNNHAQTEVGHSAEAPTNFTNPIHLLGASPALLQGKILRGGMGTGMPSWGLIYTEEQTWALVDFLWTFQFDYGE